MFVFAVEEETFDTAVVLYPLRNSTTADTFGTEESEWDTVRVAVEGQHANTQIRRVLLLQFVARFCSKIRLYFLTHCH